jgi:small GTP-binding protein
MNSEMNTLKASLVGSEGIGKSSLARAIARERFEYEYTSTIGADIKHRYIQEANLKLQVWDLAGQVRFEKIIESYISSSPVLVACYDSTNYNSFVDLRRRLHKLHNDGHLRNKHIIVVSLKSDLTIINQENWGSEIAIMYEAPFIRTSARSRDGVGKLTGELVSIGQSMYPQYFELEEEKDDKLCLDRCVII